MPGFFDLRRRAHIRRETTMYVVTIRRTNKNMTPQPRVSGGLVKLNGHVAMTERGGSAALTRGAMI